MRDYFNGEYVSPEDFNACLEYLFYFHEYFWDGPNFSISEDMFDIVSEKGKKYSNYSHHKRIAEDASIE